MLVSNIFKKKPILDLSLVCSAGVTGVVIYVFSWKVCTHMYVLTCQIHHVQHLFGRSILACMFVPVRYIMYNDWLPEHALISVRILHAVCQSALVQPKIVSILTDDEVNTPCLCCVGCIIYRDENFQGPQNFWFFISLIIFLLYRLHMLGFCWAHIGRVKIFFPQFFRVISWVKVFMSHYNSAMSILFYTLWCKPHFWCRHQTFKMSVRDSTCLVLNSSVCPTAWGQSETVIWCKIYRDGLYDNQVACRWSWYLWGGYSVQVKKKS